MHPYVWWWRAVGGFDQDHGDLVVLVILPVNKVVV
jgi:hypothetical protein